MRDRYIWIQCPDCERGMVDIEGVTHDNRTCQCDMCGHRFEYLVHGDADAEGDCTRDELVPLEAA